MGAGALRAVQGPLEERYREARVGFTDVRLGFALDTDASEDQLATPLRLTERHLRRAPGTADCAAGGCGDRRRMSRGVIAGAERGRRSPCRPASRARG